MVTEWKTIKKWSSTERREITVHALYYNEKMIGYTIKSLPLFGLKRYKGFYTLYSGNRDFAMSCDVANTLVEARAKLKRILL